MIKKFKAWVHDLLLSDATPKEVSEGFAIGIFIALTPTLGFHTWIALALAALLKKNKIAALIGVYLTNPLTVIPIFYFNLRLGEWILGRDIPIPFKPEILLDWRHLGGSLLIPLWAGSLAVAIPTTILGYYFCLWFYKRLLKRFRERHAAHTR